MRRYSRFIGREKELGILEKAIGSHVKGICIYGPRRVGKTALIKRAMEDLDPSSVIYYECIRGTYTYNIELLAKEAAAVLSLPYIRNLRDIFDIFEAIARERRGQHMTVVIDEYPYMRERLDGGVVDSYIQRILDTMSDDITVILSGSYITVMKEMLEEGQPLFGRIGRVLELQPFSYLDSARFYPSLSVRDRIAFYSVFGGYPFALCMIDESKSLYENISENLLDDGAMVRTTVENVLFAEAGRSGLPSEILSRIGNGRMRFREIEDLMSEDVAGTLDRSLKRLIGMGIVSKFSPINRKDDRRKTFYEISDNLLRFFFSYIMPNRAMIRRSRPDDFFRMMIEPSLDTYISKRFESIAIEYFTLTAGPDAVDIGTYWYDDRKRHMNGEFDCVLKLRNGSYQVYEAKYLKKPMSEDLYRKERGKMEAIEDMDISSYGFISSSGFGFDTSQLPDRFISGDELYDVSPL